MTMKLYSWDLSPYSARVRMQIYAKGLTDIAIEQPPTYGTPKFYQDLQNVATVLGISKDAVERMMIKFTKTLPEGADAEANFYAQADALMKVADTGERARIAVERFGRSGVQMLSILSKGKEGFEDMAKGFKTLSQLEIEQIEGVNKKLEETYNWFTILAGKSISSIGKTFWMAAYQLYGGPGDPGRALANQEQADNKEIQAQRDAQRAGAAADASYNQHREDVKAMNELEAAQHEVEYRKMSTADKILDLQKQQLKIQHDANDLNTLADVANAGIELLKIEDKITDLKKQQKREAEQEQKIREKTAYEQERLGFNQKIAAQRRLAPYQSSIEQLAESGYLNNPQHWSNMGQTRWIQGPFAQTAQEIIRLQGDAQLANQWGNVGRRDWDIKRIKELRTGLESAGVLSPEIALEKMQEHLFILATRASGGFGGVIVAGTD